MVYLQDILVFSVDLETRLQHICVFLSRLNKNSKYAKLEKCLCEHLGCVIWDQGLLMDPQKLSVVLKWIYPQRLHAVQSFLGFTNYYCQFISHFSTPVAPMTWVQHQEFDSAFVSASFRHHPDPSGPFFLEVDTTSVGVGVALFQRNNKGKIRTCAFLSKTFSPAEKHYCRGDCHSSGSTLKRHPPPIKSLPM